MTERISPLVSVVMGVYNGAGSLAATVDSVLSQQDCDFEFVIVNDGSTDNTGALLNEYAKRDERVRVLHQENTGLTRALISGCAAARGEFIARQDAGDVSQPGRLSRQARCLQENAVLSFVSGQTDYLGPDGEFLYRSAGSGVARHPADVVDHTSLHGMVDGPSHHGCTMFRRCTYLESGGYREEFRLGQDWDLWYRLAERGQFVMLADVQYCARIGLADISVSNKRVQEQFARLSRKCLELRANGLDESHALAEAAAIPRASLSVANRTARGAYFVGECLRRNGNKAAAHYFKTAIRNRPWQLKAWVRLMQATLA